MKDRFFVHSRRDARVSLGQEDTIAATEDPKRKKKMLSVNNILIALLMR